MIENLQNLIEQAGISPFLSLLISKITILCSILIISIAANWIAKKIILMGLKKLIAKSKTHWDDIFIEKKVLDRLSQIVPALIIHLLVPIAFPDSPVLISITKRIMMSYMILIGALTIDSLLNVVIHVYRHFKISKRYPISSYIQVVKIFVYIITTIFVISTMLNNSPWGILSSLGAMTAILMLVFKDTILGFVASIQLASLNMLRVGDWIEIPKFGADGDVIEITLNTVKVQNWDKTISTIPTYALISESFKNWRGMSESGGRRIKRSINIDISTIRFCDKTMQERFKKIEILKDYLEQKNNELKEYNQKYNINTDEIVNGRRITNIGTFRAYIIEYLKRNPKIDQNFTFLIRQLPSGANGLPIEIYVFSNDQNWINYEGIQADIFDHLFAVVSEFQLKIFQNPSGNDLQHFLQMNQN